MDPMYVYIPASQFKRKYAYRGGKLDNEQRKRIRLPTKLRSVVADITSKNKDKKKGGIAKLEDPMYPILVESMNSVMELAGYDARFKIVGHNPENNVWDSKPDIVLYPLHDTDAKTAYTNNLTEQQLEEQPDVARCAWAFMLTVMEVKSEDARAGFYARAGRRKKKQQQGGQEEEAMMDVDEEEHETGEDGHGTEGDAGGEPSVDIESRGAEASASDEASFEETDYSDIDFSAPPDDALPGDMPPMSAEAFINTSGVGNKARAQHAKYASQIMLRQHRTHVITFSLSGEEVRVYRWDRAGCVMTEPINLVENPWDFFDLLYALARIAKRDERVWGYDETVTKATKKEIQLLEDYEPPNDYQKSMKKLILANKTFYPIYKVACPSVSMDKSEHEGAAMHFLIGRYISGHGTPVGRCTRGYIAFKMHEDKSQHALCFMKDQWRAKLRKPELDAYRALHRAKTPFIPTPIAGGDVGIRRTAQHTLTQDYLHPTASKQKAYTRVHTRLVTKEVCQPLETYKSSKDLLLALFCAAKAHSVAWTEAHILHRDISSGNIMINSADGVGMLIDWDLSKAEEDFGKPPCEPGGMSGTWPFMSCLSLQYPMKPPQVADDLEALIWLALFFAFRFHEHALSSKPLEHPLTENIRSANRENKPLHDHINSVFYEERQTGGFFVGGKRKYGVIMLSDKQPPIELTHQDSLLDTFIRRAFALLKEHHLAVDLESLQKYLPKIHNERASARTTPPLSNNAQPAPSTPTPEVDGLAAAAAMGLFDGIKLSGINLAENTTVAPAAGPSRPTRALPTRKTKTRKSSRPAQITQPANPSPSSNAHRRVFDTHDELLALFAALLSPQSAIRNDNDYYYDQFISLGDGTINNTGERNSVVETKRSGSSKRTKAEAAADEDEASAEESVSQRRRAKKAKTARKQGKRKGKRTHKNKKAQTAGDSDVENEGENDSEVEVLEDAPPATRKGKGRARSPPPRAITPEIIDLTEADELWDELPELRTPTHQRMESRLLLPRSAERPPPGRSSIAPMRLPGTPRTTRKAHFR
ncbi:hypothetical protein PsYK624_026330 [Phanerochaete sordida]|uniref:Fungal-type protein kinase domain-containing protein n=1 Tax=Phanerochaete sordida TaxID=48140 RepID=A0A9P3G083_9APHY|nr:hypothetical protein PsYK624_026330 [Phanerochaete sordida]